MTDILLFIQVMIGILLIIVILIQQTGTDGLKGLSGSSSNMGVMSARSVTNFMHKLTAIIAIIFFANSLILANLSSTKNKTSIIEKVKTQTTDNIKDKKDNISIAE